MKLMKFTLIKKSKTKIKKLKICKDALEAELKTKRLFIRMRMNQLRTLSNHHLKMRMIRIFVSYLNKILFSNLRIKRSRKIINYKIKILIIPIILRINCQKMYFLIENLKELRLKSRTLFKLKS